MLRQLIPSRGVRALSKNLSNLPASYVQRSYLRTTRGYVDRAVLQNPLSMKSLLLCGTRAQSSLSPRNVKLEESTPETKSNLSRDQGSESNKISHVDDIEITGAIKAELKIFKQTFSMEKVPRDSLYIGVAGVLPYAATSISTVYLAWDINHAELSGEGYLLSPETAHYLLNLITPIQIGYGAIIISFLGAIHWGLEYAGFGGKHSYRRLRYGVIAPVIAWPTLLMPVEMALISQFLAFNYMYFVDARATVKGWFPAWYSIYRFVLTFFVGATIVTSLIGRGQIIRPEQNHLRSLLDHARSERELQFLGLESENNSKRQTPSATDEESDE